MDKPDTLRCPYCKGHEIKVNHLSYRERQVPIAVCLDCGTQFNPEDDYPDCEE